MIIVYTWLGVVLALVGFVLGILGFILGYFANFRLDILELQEKKQRRERQVEIETSDMIVLRRIMGDELFEKLRKETQK